LVPSGHDLAVGFLGAFGQQQGADEEATEPISV
jgi:hypothetical protein